MAFTTYTRDELRQIVIDHIRGRVPGANVAVYSDYWHLATGIATAVHGDHAAAQYLVRQILPSTAEKKFLDAHAALRQLSRLQPTKAIGKILVPAVALTSITSGRVLEHASGVKLVVTATAMATLPAWSSRTVAPGTTATRIVLNADATGISVDDTLETPSDYGAVKAVIPDVGTAVAIDLYRPMATVPSVGASIAPTEGAVVDVQAVEAGIEGNLEPSELVTFEVPLVGEIEDPLVLEMSGGGDLETDEELRARVLAWLAERPGSGNRADYRQWARETPDVRVVDAFVYPSYRGLGSVDVVPLGASGVRQTGTAVNALVQDHLESEASFQDDLLVRQLADAAVMAVTLEVQVGPGYEPDWTGTYTAHGTQSSTTEVRLTAAPTDIEIGDRVLVAAGDKGPRLFEREVVGKKSGPDRIVLDAALPDTPTPGATVYPGGPSAQDLIDAVVALFDDLGPGDTTPPTRYPSPLEAHSDVLPLARLTATAMAVAGTVDVEVVAPATDQTPATLQRLALGQLTIQLTTDPVP